MFESVGDTIPNDATSMHPGSVLFTPMFDLIIDHPKGSLVFRDFCGENFVLENWECLQAIRQFKLQVQQVRRQVAGEEIVSPSSSHHNSPSSHRSRLSQLFYTHTSTTTSTNAHQIVTSPQHQQSVSTFVGEHNSETPQKLVLNQRLRLDIPYDRSVQSNMSATSSSFSSCASPSSSQGEKSYLEKRKSCGLTMRDVLVTDIYRIMNTYIDESAHRQVNIDSDTRKNCQAKLQKLKLSNVKQEVEVIPPTIQYTVVSSPRSPTGDSDSSFSQTTPRDTNNLNTSSNSIVSQQAVLQTSQEQIDPSISKVDHNEESHKVINLALALNTSVDSISNQVQLTARSDNSLNTSTYNIGLIGSFAVPTSPLVKTDDFKDVETFFDQVEMLLLLLLKDDVFPRFVRSKNWFTFLRMHPQDAKECAKKQDIEDLKRMRFDMCDFRRMRVTSMDFERCERLFADSILFELLYDNFEQNADRRSKNKIPFNSSQFVGVYFSNGENFIDESSIGMGKFGVQKNLGYLNFPAELVLSALSDMTFQQILMPAIEYDENLRVCSCKGDAKKYYPSTVLTYRMNMGKFMTKRTCYASTLSIYDENKKRYYFLSKPIYNNAWFQRYMDPTGKKTIPCATLVYASVIPVSKSKCKLIYVVVGNLGGALSKFSSVLFKSHVSTLAKNISQHLHEELVKRRRDNFKDLFYGYNAVKNSLEQYYRQTICKRDVLGEENTTMFASFSDWCPFPTTFEAFQKSYS